MGARQKLNRAYVNGTVLSAAAAGLLCQSWEVFVLALGILLALNVQHQEIRPHRRHGGRHG
jgi:hypothetical protein